MPKKVLGLNFSIDSAAALVDCGQIVAAACQERFDRIKHSWAFPTQAIAFCLEKGGIRLDDLDSVAVSWNPANHLARPNRLRETIYRDHRELLETIPARLLAMMEQGNPGTGTNLNIDIDDGKDLPINYVDHHLSHAAGAFYCSGFDKAAILTVDGYGEQASTMLAKGGPEGVTPIRTIDFPHSLGSIYAAVTTFLGYNANCDEGKVMALAGMGDPGRYGEKFRKVVTKTDDGFEVDLDYFRYFMPSKARYSKRFVDTFGKPRLPGEPILEIHHDLAAALQETVSDILLHLAGLLQQETGLDNICLAGGVAMNSVAMGVIERLAPYKNIFVLPPAHDGGGGLGAAMHTVAAGGKYSLEHPYSDFLGSEYSQSYVQDRLNEYGIKFIKDDGPIYAADMIANGKIVGYMNGPMEYGPRALGARSILADPRELRFKEIVNAKVKHREAYRPFAPIALEETIGDWFVDAKPTPFMNKVYNARPMVSGSIQAVVHVDGSVRLQTVSKIQNQPMYKLVSHFASLTGVPMVLNTSFNKQGEPIVENVDQALSCFFTSGMDALVIGDLVIRK